MKKIILFLITLIFFLFNPLICRGEELTVMILIEEKLPSEITGLASEQMTEFLEKNGYKTILFPENKNLELGHLISCFLYNNEGELKKIAREEGALFLICGKLQAMEKGTTTVYDTTLFELELFGDIKLCTLNTEAELPLSLKIKEKGLSVKLQESYQQSLGKAMESIQKTLLSEFKIIKIELKSDNQ